MRWRWACGLSLMQLYLNESPEAKIPTAIGPVVAESAACRIETTVPPGPHPGPGYLSRPPPRLLPQTSADTPSSQGPTKGPAFVRRRTLFNFLPGLS